MAELPQCGVRRPPVRRAARRPQVHIADISRLSERLRVNRVWKLAGGNRRSIEDVADRIATELPRLDQTLAALATAGGGR